MPCKAVSRVPGQIVTQYVHKIVIYVYFLLVCLTFFFLIAVVESIRAFEFSCHQLLC